MILADERLFCASSVSAHYFVEFSLKSDEVKSRKTFYFGYCSFFVPNSIEQSSKTRPKSTKRRIIFQSKAENFQLWGFTECRPVFNTKLRRYARDVRQRS